jgi:SOS response regulatory protein OraA/RecX
MRGSLRELDVSADLIEQIIEQIREGYLLDDDE